MSSTYIYCVIALCIAAVSAFSKEDMSALMSAVHPHIMACSKDFGIPEEKLKDAKKSENISGIDPCFLSCLFKAVGAMNDEGNFDPDAIIEKSKEFLKGEDDKKNFEEVSRTCAKVNEEPVSDGEKGCDRAKLLMTCIMQNKGDFHIEE